MKRLSSVWNWQRILSGGRQRDKRRNTAYRARIQSLEPRRVYAADIEIVPPLENSTTQQEDSAATNPAENFTPTPSTADAVFSSYGQEPTPSGSFAPTPTGTFAPTPSVSFTPTPTGTFAPTPTGTFAPTPTVSFAPTPSGSFAPTPTGTFAPTPTGTFAPTPTGTFAPTPTVSFAPTPSGSFAPTPSGSFAPTPSGSFAPTPTGSFAPTPSGSFAPTPSGSFAPTPTGSFAPTPTGTFSPTPTGTFSPTPTGTFAPTPTGTFAPTPTGTFAPTPTGTFAPTPSGSFAPTPNPSGQPVPGPGGAPEFVFPEPADGQAAAQSYTFVLPMNADSILGSVRAEDPDGDRVTYSTGDQHFSVDATTGSITVSNVAYVYSADSPNTYTFTVIASDGVLETTTSVTIDLAATVRLQVHVNMTIELNDAQFELLRLQRQLADIDRQRTENMWAYIDAGYGDYGTRLLALKENAMLPPRPGDSFIFTGINLNHQYNEIQNQIDAILAEGTDRERPNYIPEAVWQAYVMLYGNNGTSLFHQYAVGVSFDSRLHGFEVSAEGYSVVVGGDSAEQQARNLKAALVTASENRRGDDGGDDTWMKYVVNATLFTFVGDQAEVDVNALGVAGSIVFGLTGLDAYKDAADLAYAVENWEWSWTHAGGAALTVVGLIPVIGVVKNLRGAAALNELKHVDDVSNAPGDVKALIRSGDVKVVDSSGEVVADGSATLTKTSPTNGGPTTGAGGPVINILQNTCFRAGTPVRTPCGAKTIEQLKVGDQVLARPEHSPFAEVRTQVIERTFELSADILEVRLGGQSIETTAEHPFYVAEKGWVRAANLDPGDMIVGHNDQLTAVEQVSTTDRHETVYNIRVSNDHTYFVGNDDWGFSAWVHNAYRVISRDGGQTYDIVDVSESGVERLVRGGFLNAADAQKSLDFSTNALRDLDPDVAMRAMNEYDDLLRAGRYEDAADLAERVRNGTYAPKGSLAKIGMDQLEAKWKHAVDFGITTTKRNPTTLAQFGAAIRAHLDDAGTIVKGTYGWVKDSVVHFNPNTNLVVVLDKAGNFVTGFKLGTKQLENFLKNGFLK